MRGPRKQGTMVLSMNTPPASQSWPALPFEDWTDTLETLHLWTQIVGKIRMVKSPWINHSWSVPLYVSSKGLTTSLVPYESEGFELAFDFLADELVLTTTTNERRGIALAPRSVADFYGEVMSALEAVGMPEVPRYWLEMVVRRVR